MSLWPKSPYTPLPNQSKDRLLLLLNHLFPIYDAWEWVLALCRCSFRAFLVLKTFLLDGMKISMIFMLVSFSCIYGPEGFFAMVTGDNNSFQMICLNVIFYDITLAFFSTHFANVGLLTSICYKVFTFLHHRPHLFFKLFHIPRELTHKC